MECRGRIREPPREWDAPEHRGGRAGEGIARPHLGHERAASLDEQVFAASRKPHPVERRGEVGRAQTVLRDPGGESVCNGHRQDRGIDRRTNGHPPTIAATLLPSRAIIPAGARNPLSAAVED